MALDTLWERLRNPGSTRRGVLLTAALALVAIALAYGATLFDGLNAYAQKALGRDAPVVITDGAKHGLIAEKGYSYSFPKYDGKLHLRHFPPCADNDPGCAVDLDVRQETSAPRVFVFVIVLAIAMFMFGLAAVLLSGRRSAGVLHGRRFVQIHTMRIVNGDEDCYVQRTCEDLRTEGTSLLIPTRLNYVQKYATGQAPVRLEQPTFKWNGTDVEMTKVNQSDDYYDGIIWFTQKKGPVTFYLNYRVVRNMYRNVAALHARKGKVAPPADDHCWSSPANWDEVELQFDWSNDFSVSSPKAFLTAGHGASEKEIKPGPLFSIISNGQGQMWTVKLKNVATTSEVRVAWTLQ